MKPMDSHAENVDRILTFIQERFLPDELRETFDETSPLLRLGVLDSMNTAILLNFIRRDLDVTISASSINAETFRDVRSIAAAVGEIGKTSPA